MPRATRTLVALLLTAAITGSVAGCAATPGTAAPAPSSTPSSVATAPAVDEAQLAAAFDELEQEFDARLGVVAMETGTDRMIEHRSGERFAYASTIKALAAAVLLQELPPGGLERVIRYNESELLDYAPVTEGRVDTGMTLAELADAAVRHSDNTAGNLVMKAIGGPEELQAALVAAGDVTTSVDRMEPELNSAEPGDVRDTTTPLALAADLRHFALGDGLEGESQQQLGEWLIGSTTGSDLIRAGVPGGWTVGDKTGAAAYGTRNDIAVIWPPGDDAAAQERGPVVLVVMSDRAHEGAEAEYDDALIARATEVIFAALTKR